MLSNTPGKKLEKYNSDYVIFDLETTGISARYDEVIEISALKVKNHEIVEEFSQLVNPKRAIPYGASAVNGIRDDMVENAPVFEDVLPSFIQFIEEDILVGHNIHSFDMKFIYRDAEKYLGKVPNNDYIDTLSLARKCLPELSHHRLTDLAEHYHLSTKGAHRALNDCYMNQQVFEYLGQQLNRAGEESSNLKICPKCQQIMTRRNGKFGEFWGCGGYPKCRYTENIR